MTSKKRSKHKDKNSSTNNVDDFIKVIKNKLFVQRQTIEDLSNKVSSLDINIIEDQSDLVMRRNGKLS